MSSTTTVQLAVYDLSRGMAQSMSQAILGQRIDGIWHTGIVAFGKEYYFGGGIQVSPWGVFAQSNNMPPVQVLDMGTTTKTQVELETYLRSIYHLYTQYTYDLINNNCNNFANTICIFLTGHGIPTHIVDLPRIVFSTPGGAMLRPMIESMQNNVRQQHGHALDPFANNPPPVPVNDPAGQRFESALSDSMRSVLEVNALQTNQNISKTLKLAKLDESALVSGDASTVSTTAMKILNLTGSDGVKGSALSEEEKATINKIVQTLTSASQSKDKKQDLFTIEDYLMMEKILALHPNAHMSCLFLVRLMFLHDHVSDFTKLNIVHEIMKRLLGKHEIEDNKASSGVSGFASVPAHIMAICAMSNLLSHDAGTSFLLGTSNGSSEEAMLTEANVDFVNELVDIVLGGLTHSRAEVRQMSSALAYNLTLACTKNHKPSGPWQQVSSDETELNPHALQLLCCCLEGVSQEKDALVRQRKLATACRIARSFNAAFITLVNDLGFTDAMQILQADKDIQPKLSTDERAILDELLYYLLHANK